MVVYTLGDGSSGPVRWIIAGLAVAVLVTAIIVSKRRSAVVEAGETSAPEPREPAKVA